MSISIRQGDLHRTLTLRDFNPPNENVKMLLKNVVNLNGKSNTLKVLTIMTVAATAITLYTLSIFSTFCMSVFAYKLVSNYQGLHSAIVKVEEKVIDLGLPIRLAYVSEYHLKLNN